MEVIGLWKEINMKIKGWGNVVHLPLQNRFFSCSLLPPLVFAIFLSLSVNALIPSLKTGVEALLVSEEKVS